MDLLPQLSELRSDNQVNQPALRFGDTLYPTPFVLMPNAAEKINMRLNSDTRFDIWRMLYHARNRDAIQLATGFSPQYVAKVISGDGVNNFLGLNQILGVDPKADSARALQANFLFSFPGHVSFAQGKIVELDQPENVLEKILTYTDGMKTWALYAMGYSQPQISEMLGIQKTAYYARMKRIIAINAITEEECAKKGLDPKLVLSAFFWQTVLTHDGILENLDLYNKT